MFQWLQFMQLANSLRYQKRNSSALYKAMADISWDSAHWWLGQPACCYGSYMYVASCKHKLICDMVDHRQPIFTTACVPMLCNKTQS